MPLFKTITPWPDTQIYIWKIEESLDILKNTKTLSPYSEGRLANMKSMAHQCGFLSIRWAMKAAGYADSDLYYDDLGKPHLQDGRFISITHAHGFSGIILSGFPVGIDIEAQRTKIQRIAHKFALEGEHQIGPDKEHDVAHLTKIWTAKESMYKLVSEPGLSFLNQMVVAAFSESKEHALGRVAHQGITRHFELRFDDFEGYTCGYTREVDQS